MGQRHSDAGQAATEYNILHIPVSIDSVLHGVASFIIDGAKPAATDNEALPALFQLFAANALRAKNLQIARARLDQANLLSQISQAITSSLDLKTVFNQTTEMAASILNAEAATLFSIDMKRRQLLFMIAKGTAAQVLEEKRIPLDQGVVGWVAMNGKPLVVNNTRASDLFNSQVDSQTGFSTNNILCVPLRIQDRTIGVLEVLNKDAPEGFTQDDVDWLSAMGQHIAIALENAQLYENLRREQERIIKAQEEVRNHLARELHDNTAQMLSLIIMNLDLARQLLGKQSLERLDAELQRIEEYAKQANREVRTLLFELRPIILESRGLVPALHAYHRQLQGSMTSKIHLDASPLGFEISLQGASIIFSIIQEAVNNIRKHARAKNIWIRVSADSEKLHFSVEDDGVGFDLNAVTVNYEERGSFGLFNMRERAALLAGYLDVYSPRPNASNGTLITGFVPLSSMIGSQDAK
ncbi:MAG: GAF domain-containing sensor histidine kinase [Caldilineaceae bacterium]